MGLPAQENPRHLFLFQLFHLFYSLLAFVLSSSQPPQQSSSFNPQQLPNQVTGGELVEGFEDILGV